MFRISQLRKTLPPKWRDSMPLLYLHPARIWAWNCLSAIPLFAKSFSIFNMDSRACNPTVRGRGFWYVTRYPDNCWVSG